MKIKEFFNIINKGFNDLFKTPLLIIPGLLLWVFILLFQKISVIINHGLNNTNSLIAWLVFFSLVSLAMMSFVFSGLIKISKEIITRKKEIARNFFSNGKKFWFRNFLSLLLIVVIGIVIWAIANYGGIYIGKLLNLEVNTALLLYILIYFAGLIGVLIFLTFSNVCLVVYDLNFKEGIKKSIKLVKKEYLATLTLNVLIFVILFLLNKVKGIWIDLIEYVLLIPLFILVFTRFVIFCEKER